MALVSARWPTLILIGFLILNIQSVAAIKPLVPALLVFGDSTCDPGNNNYIQTALKSDFPPYGRDLADHQATGRFCNGRLGIDFIAEGLGLKKTIPPYLDPHLSPHDLVTGVSFASAGTGYDNMTASILNVIPLWKEIEYFKEYQFRLKQMFGEKIASIVINKALYLVSVGTNDFIENYLQFPNRRLRFSPSEYVDFIVGIAGNFFEELYRLGARRISVASLSPMGCLPMLRSMNLFEPGQCMEDYNDIGLQYNAKLQTTIENLRHKLPGLLILFSDSYQLTYEAIYNPSKYGFEEAERACCGSGTIELGYLCNELIPSCSDASTFVFWDSVHPTERFYEIVANNMLQSIRRLPL
ncbi:hypothetical protein SUGI_0559570 [Cryptomeria japonica]|uniref:GDSL esterase/lipase At4g26790 n=1 Tax=Cryptomeria japonica TaxID=3369 RepID=UPI002408BA09|nr:GDSL esterase/lipase At4g26790 [Cryptomeria japonica]GLJ28439.1 hypothetical protein SUGI_0559570 [Cryptomeria japonica]